MYKPVRPGRLYEKIVEQIEESILNGELKPGDKLPSEHELAEQFNVSRTAVREAVKTLTQKGLVVVYVGRGTFVTDGTSEVVRHSLGLMLKIGQEEGSQYLVEIRDIIEPEIAALAASRARDEIFASLHEAVELMDRSLGDTHLFIEADLDFHLALAEGTHNPIVLLLVDALVDLLRDLRVHTARAEGALIRAQEHHKRILEAVQARDPEAAREAMRQHLNQVREDSIGRLN
jgi:GntR family transcriptional regulator, transcriptional repressor for pyruvate dehydrogenase complex